MLTWMRCRSSKQTATENYLRVAFDLGLFAVALAGRRLVTDFFGAAAALVVFRFAPRRVGGPAAARAARSESASSNVSSSGAVPLGKDAFV